MRENLFVFEFCSILESFAPFYRYLGNWDNDVEAAIAHDKATINIFGKNGSGTINFPLEGTYK